MAAQGRQAANMASPGGRYVVQSTPRHPRRCRRTRPVSCSRSYPYGDGRPGSSVSPSQPSPGPTAWACGRQPLVCGPGGGWAPWRGEPRALQARHLDPHATFALSAWRRLASSRSRSPSTLQWGWRRTGSDVFVPTGNLPRWLMISLIIFCAAILSSMVGFAFSAIAGALILHYVTDGVEAVQIMMIASIGIQAYSVACLWRSIQWERCRPFIAGGVAAFPCGIAAPLAPAVAHVHVRDGRRAGVLWTVHAGATPGAPQERASPHGRCARRCAGRHHRTARGLPWRRRHDLVRHARMGQSRAKGGVSAFHPHHAAHRR